MNKLLNKYRGIKSTKKGFTLVELLVVIAILAVLASVSVIGYLGFTTKARNSNAMTELAQVREVLRAELIDGSEHYYKYDSAASGSKWSEVDEDSTAKPLLSLQYSNNSLTYTFADSDTASNLTWDDALEGIFTDLASLNGEIQVTATSSSTTITSIQYFNNGGKAQWTISGDVLTNGDAVTVAQVEENKIVVVAKESA